jgi:hypothetical protein
MWINLTGDEITISFISNPFTTGAPTQTVASHQPSVVWTVSNAAAVGTYPYTVYCKVTNTNAIGSAGPEIIVEP